MDVLSTTSRMPLGLLIVRLSTSDEGQRATSRLQCEGDGRRKETWSEVCLGPTSGKRAATLNILGQAL